MAWVPVAVLYLFVGLGLLSLLVAPVQLVWRAFWVRPMVRKYRKMQGRRSSLPVAVQNSDRYKKTRRDEEVLLHTRFRAVISLILLALVLESRFVMQGFAWPPVPGDLDAINRLASRIFAHMGGAIERIGFIWVAGGAVGAVVAGVLGVGLLDLLGDGLGTPLRMAGDHVENRKKKAAKDTQEARKQAEEAAADPVADVVNYYAELDVPTAANPDAIAGVLASVEAQWNRRLSKGDDAMQGRARKYLALIAEARETLLDAEKRLEYDRRIGLRGGSGGVKKNAVMVDARKVDDAAVKKIEEMKKKRKAQRAGDPNIKEKP